MCVRGIKIAPEPVPHVDVYKIFLVYHRTDTSVQQQIDQPGIVCFCFQIFYFFNPSTLDIIDRIFLAQE